MSTESQLRVGRFLDRLFWALLLSVSTFIANQVSDLARSVGQLNTQMAIVVTKMSNQEKSIDLLDQRIRTLEQKKH